MEVVTLDSQVYVNVMEKLDAIYLHVKSHPQDTIQLYVPEKIKENTEERIELHNKDVCRMLGISLRTLNRIRQRGEIAFTRVGGGIRYYQDDIDDYLNRQKIEITEKSQFNPSTYV